MKKFIIKTKSNIRNNINDLSEENFKKIYNSVKEKYESNKIQNFNGFLYQALYENWNILSKTVRKELDENKKKWLSRFAGIISNKDLKSEVENIIITIPFEILQANKNILAKMNTFEFKQHLLSLKRKC